MRFKAQIQNINTFNKFVASLASLGPVAWVRLNENEVRFTIIPEQGTQVWAVLAIDTIFDNYTIQSAADNVINLEVPLQSLQRALKSALNATSASIRLTKKDGAPFLCLTITNSSLSSTPYSALAGANQRSNGYDHEDRESTDFSAGSREREVTITQDVPIRVLSVANVEGIHEPRCREPDVHILLPPLMQLKSISDRFTKLALASKSQSSGLNTIGPRLEMAANMHGCLRISIKTDAMNISSAWTGLSNPELDPGQIEGGQDGVANHPSTRMKAKGAADGRGEEGWAKVRIDGRDWGKVMSVGRVGGKVIACFCDDHALILYVYLASEGDDEGSVLTYYVSSYSV
ncbi:putative cell cycle checkpoint protein [Venturia nashicola]|nr:putative cell cycle checkpoint protein [Venturia nashicola]